MESNPLRILLHFDRWATERLFAVCGQLSDAQLDQEFPIGLKSLRRTFGHLVGNMNYWADIADGRPARPFDSSAGPLDEIVRRFEAAWDDLSGILSRSTPARLEEVITDEFDNREFGKGTIGFRRVAVLLHVLNHGTHHRAQCLNMLRHLGVNPLPEIDLIDSHQTLERKS